MKNANGTKRNSGIMVRGNTISITKAFEKRASIYGSAEYYELLGARRDNPKAKIEYKVVKSKNTYAGLTIERMEAYIQLRSPEKIQQFEFVQKVADTRQGKYAHVKKWFLGAFPDFRQEDMDELYADSRKVG